MRSPLVYASPRSSPLLAAISGNNDELERNQRRKSRVINLQEAACNASGSPSAPGSPIAVPKLSNTEISEHYSTCIKLSTENKITTKNAFGLHLIDYMADIVNSKDSAELTNFKLAAGTLDAGTKIYGMRVDAVHADTYKVLGGLGAETKPTKGAEPEGETGETSEGEEAAKEGEKKKKARPPKKTVEHNLCNINRTEAESCEVDPVFQRMTASFDENNPSGIFMSWMQCEDTYCQLLLPSNVTLLNSKPLCPPPPPNQCVPSQSFLGRLEQVPKKKSFCPSLESFRFSGWDPEQSMNEQREKMDKMLDKMKEGKHAFDANNGEPDLDEDFQDYGEDMDDQPGDCGGSPVKQMNGCEVSHKGKDVVAIGKADISSMCMLLSSNVREYSYFSPKTMASWAGPGFWKFKPKHQQDHGTDKEKPKRKPKKVFEIDFGVDINFDTYFRITRAATTNPVKKTNVKKASTTLPKDFHYSPQNLSKTSLKPSNAIYQVDEKTEDAEEVADGIGDYDYNNANDTANFCPASQESDDDDGAPDDAQLPADDLPPCPDMPPDACYGEMGLVAEPPRVKVIEINYAKQEKKMDMKRLKNNMWDLLTVSPENKKARAEDTPKVEGEKGFSEITKTLLHRLPPNMAQNLSAPMAFVALLHLANEKNLVLNNTNDMSDIVIKQSHH